VAIGVPCPDVPVADVADKPDQIPQVKVMRGVLEPYPVGAVADNYDLKSGSSRLAIAQYSRRSKETVDTLSLN
jgi:hypothetical protein